MSDRNERFDVVVREMLPLVRKSISILGKAAHHELADELYTLWAEAKECMPPSPDVTTGSLTYDGEELI